MDLTQSELGEALLGCGTSNQWSTLEAVARKVSKRLNRPVSCRELDDFLLAGEADMREIGVWRTSFGAKYMPILLVNPAFGRARAEARARNEEPGCSCGASGSSGASTEGMKRYFGSHDYNAGRHAANLSEHKPNCCLWAPPDAGHLHSWRRAFTEPA
ncbi:unnamed protein product [Effrenium voratum]|nr:unnamed protein product [Effrenium voratum]